MSNICQAGGTLFSKKTPFLQHFGQMLKKRRLAQSWKCWLNCLRTSKKLTFTQAERSRKNHFFSSKVKCPISVKRGEHILTANLNLQTFFWYSVSSKSFWFFCEKSVNDRWWQEWSTIFCDNSDPRSNDFQFTIVIFDDCQRSTIIIFHDLC